MYKQMVFFGFDSILFEIIYVFDEIKNKNIFKYTNSSCRNEMWMIPQ